MHELAGTSRAFDFEIVAVVMMKLLEGFDQEVIDREPDRTAPVGVAAENAGLRFGRFVADDFFFAANRDRVGMRLMKFAEGTNSVVAQKFFRIEHAPQQTFHPMSAGERNETQLFHARFLPARNQRRQIWSIL